MDAKLFNEAIELLVEEKHVKKEVIVEALKEALKKAYIKDAQAAEEADVRVLIREEEPATIDILHVLEVVEDDEEEDKSLQIAFSEANKEGSYKVGDEFIKKVDPDKLTRLAALAVKSILKQKLSDLEKAALYETHKDNVGSLISAVVDKCDDHGAIVTIDRTSFSLSRKDLIGDETFKPGEIIQLYLSEVSNGEKGPTLKLSRSDVGFLKCVIDDEVMDVHNGYVIIKNVVRMAGVRSKVAVYSTNAQVDAVKACLGKGSTTLRNVMKRVGEKSSHQEKVNFVAYSEDPLIYASEALRPANILKIAKDSFEITDKNGETKELIKIIAVVGDDPKEYGTAVGARQSNLKLAQQLTGYTIEIITEKELQEESTYEDLEFVSIEDIRTKMESEKTTKTIVERAEEIIKSQPAVEAVPASSAAYVKTKPQQILDEDLEEAKEEPVVMEKPEEATTTSPVEEAPKVEEVTTRVVKTTTSLEDLEKSLETSKKQEAFKGNTKKRPRKITEDEIEDETKKLSEENKKEVVRMDIYSEEELENMDDEDYDDNMVDDEDVDYEQFEEYYDDEK